MPVEFTSRLSRREAIAVLVWLPVHILVLPILLTIPMLRGYYGEATANLLVYAVGTVYLLLTLRRFFRRDFDALCDRPLRVLLLVLAAYWLSRFGETLIALLMDELSVTGSNENNDAVIQMMKDNFGPMSAMAVILAPIVEESLFRAGVFGLLYRKSRFLAYTLSVLCFALYHVWQNALYDPRQLIFILQYIPSSIALAWVYERTDSIWSSIFLHMLTNGVSVLAVTAL